MHISDDVLMKPGQCSINQCDMTLCCHYWVKRIINWEKNRTCTGGSAVCRFTELRFQLWYWDTTMTRDTYRRDESPGIQKIQCDAVCKVSQCPLLPPPLATTFGGEENVVENPRSFSHKRDLHVHVRGLRALAWDGEKRCVNLLDVNVMVKSLAISIPLYVSTDIRQFEKH